MTVAASEPVSEPPRKLSCQPRRHICDNHCSLQLSRRMPAGHEGISAFSACANRMDIGIGRRSAPLCHIWSTNQARWSYSIASSVRFSALSARLDRRLIPDVRNFHITCITCHNRALMAISQSDCLQCAAVAKVDRSEIRPGTYSPQERRQYPGRDGARGA